MHGVGLAGIGRWLGSTLYISCIRRRAIYLSLSGLIHHHHHHPDIYGTAHLPLSPLCQLCLTMSSPRMLCLLCQISVRGKDGLSHESMLILLKAQATISGGRKSPRRAHINPHQGYP
jgi:hypothetical protein